MDEEKNVSGENNEEETVGTVETDETEEIELSNSEADTDVYGKTVKQKEEEERNKPPRFLGAFEWLETFAVALSAMILIFIFLFKYVTVDGHSMDNTLANGQKLIISRVSDYENGNIIVVYEPHLKKALVKRIIAHGGQTVTFDSAEWKVYVDGVELDEPYVNRTSGPMKLLDVDETVNVPEGCVFVMGDNRNGSRDSRDITIGCIDARNILGKVVFRITPFSKFGTVN